MFDKYTITIDGIYKRQLPQKTYKLSKISLNQMLNHQAWFCPGSRITSNIYGYI